jgi:hypothetical protein
VSIPGRNEPIVLDDPPPPHAIPPQLRLNEHTLLLATVPPPATCLAVERDSGKVVRVDAENLDETLYGRVTTHALTFDAAYEVEPVE